MTFPPSSLGIDGCPAGWITVAPGEGDEWEVRLFSSLDQLWSVYNGASRLFVDIPIGLAGHHHIRACDQAVRNLLGKRRSSVFPPPVRAAAYAADYREACRLNAEHTGKKISIQAWNITRKIREADGFCQRHPAAAGKLLEAHPELNFMALAGKPMTFNKKTKEGFRERLEALLPHCPAAETILTDALNRFTRNQVTRDDVMDALCLAVNARLSLTHGLLRIPVDPPPMDSTGLPMQIVCANLNISIH